ncbi:MAG: Membrane protein, distant similarity to thiosulphate:quinone oxidoreductase DoxD [uncultured Chloroflexia bacterium]|uniref:Membrane protein, distant similarity to thiosulphate:quinone oxidoreductase DoxD n=1 Tax=uncultured Chloroflexia bacterium TaxID=1672391 RepID=A0A6J4N3D8_9CHLR|nr:MAG: Membrane protein, distant similarity to thiosulphate:quinone oxidoreductase DoxD [uncultured Chloroflexia bacterium]
MAKRTQGSAGDVGLLIARATAGGLLAGHGAQKLFGLFGGYGIQGTAGWLESTGMKPGKFWAYVAGGSEFASGLSMALGFLTPIGAVSAFAPMLTAWNKVHMGKPVWGTEGGPEMPILYMTLATMVGLAGPGRYSVDQALDIDVPAWMVAATAAGVAAGVAYSISSKPPEPEEPSADEALAAQGTGTGDAQE